jgi:hypothetical protein
MMSSQDHWEDWTKEGCATATMIDGTDRKFAVSKKKVKKEEEDRKMTKEELEEYEIEEAGLSSSDDENAIDGNVFYPADGSHPFIVKDRTKALFGLVSPVSDEKKARRVARAAALAKRVKKLQNARKKKSNFTMGGTMPC